MQGTCPPLVFWPGLGTDIDNLIRKCAVCQTHVYKQQSEPLLIRPAPEHAWYRVGVDIFDNGCKAYLCAYDAFCNFPEVELLHDTSQRQSLRSLALCLPDTGYQWRYALITDRNSPAVNFRCYQRDIISHIPPVAPGFLLPMASQKRACR